MTATEPSVRAIAKIFLVVVALSALLYVVYLARSTVGLVLISILLALALGPSVDFVDRRLPVPRALAIVIVYLIGVVLIGLIGLIVVPPIITGVKDLADYLPGQIDSLRRAGWVQDLNRHYHVVDKLSGATKDLPSTLGSAVGTLQAVTFGAFSAALKLISVLVMTFLMLLDGPRIVNWGLAQLPEPRRSRAMRIGEDVYRGIAGYVAGNLAISVIAGSVTYVTLELLGVRFAAPLAILMAFFDLVPLVGATIAGLTILGVTFLGDVPWDPIIWAVVFIAYQQIENNFLQPVVYKRTVAVPPLLTIVAILVGATLLGVLGALLAIPAAAIIQVVVKDWWSVRHSERGPASAA